MKKVLKVTNKEYDVTEFYDVDTVDHGRFRNSKEIWHKASSDPGFFVQGFVGASADTGDGLVIEIGGRVFEINYAEAESLFLLLGEQDFAKELRIRSLVPEVENKGEE